jgi:hypothetical protein
MECAEGQNHFDNDAGPRSRVDDRLVEELMKPARRDLPIFMEDETTLWLCDGMVHGHDWDHWYAAETELLIERAAATMKAAKPKPKTKSANTKR